MKYISPLLIAALCLFSCKPVQKEATSDLDLLQYVEPRIGTAHCRWFHFAPGALPFGLAKPGPATNASLGNKWGWDATGYDYRDASIEGFPCLHEFQVGGIVLMPTNGTLITVPGSPKDSVKVGYRSAFKRENEVVTPGYYSVMLDDYRIKSEVTATKRVAFFRFTYPEGETNRLLFDIGNRQGESGPARDAYVSYTEDGHVEGWVVTEPKYVWKYQNGADIRMYFSAVLDRSPLAVGTFKGNDQQADAREVQGVGSGLYLTLPELGPKPVTVKVGLSYTSVENARLNLEQEAGSLSFDQAKEAAQQTWGDYLGRIRVETDNKQDKVKFYTGLYHALLGRGLASDVNGAYPCHDGSVGQLPMKDGKPLYNLYNTDGIWGGQWNLSQVWTLAYPDYMSDYISSHLQIYKDGGWLADGVANSRYVSGVGTNLLTTVITGAYQCGIRDFDTQLAYEACLKNELGYEDRPLGAGKIDTETFLQHGYVPHQDKGSGIAEAYRFSASHTLEYSYSAWAVAQLAKQRGDTARYRQLMYLSKGWERLYDASTNFIRPKKDDGVFIDHFDPMEVWHGFQEGNAWQYTFYVPHDVKTLVSKVGQDVFTARLDSIFTQSRKVVFGGGTEIDAFAGLKTLYNHGNQPCLHISWLFNEAGRPSLTQKWVRAILNEFYGTEGIHGYGYGQDEDQGQLGAWYVISSMGLFDVKGLTDPDPSFSLGAPLFDKITVRLNEKYYPGKELVITTCGEAASHPYVQQYLWNGKPVGETRLPFRELVKGGTLEVVMDDVPHDDYAK